MLPVAEDRVLIASCYKGQGFYCYLLQRTGFYCSLLQRTGFFFLFPFVESRVCITPSCRRQGFFLFTFVKDRVFFALPAAEDRIFKVPCCRVQVLLLLYVEGCDFFYQLMLRKIKRGLILLNSERIV